MKHFFFDDAKLMAKNGAFCIPAIIIDLFWGKFPIWMFEIMEWSMLNGCDCA